MGRLPSPAVRFALVAAALAALCPPAFASPPPPLEVEEFGWTAEAFVDPTSEAQGSQIALDPAGRPLAVWAGRPTQLELRRILWSQLTGTAWSAGVPAFAPVAADELFPRLSRAPDGTLWMTWLRNASTNGQSSVLAALVAARYVDGAWSAPETLVVDMARPDPKIPQVEYSILGVSRDSAWVAFARAPDGNPFSPDRDLYAVVRSAVGWSSPAIVSEAGLAEARPVLAPTVGGQPVVFFGFRNAPSLLRAVRWTGTAWSTTPDEFDALAIFEHAAAPDTNGAVRLVAFVREENGSVNEDHIRELIWNQAGFAESLIVNTLPVLPGQGVEPPDWSNLAIVPSAPCIVCAGFVVTPQRFRVLWVDFSASGVPKVRSRERGAIGYGPFDSPGTTYERAQAFPTAVHDGNIDRWYAVWNAPPSFDGKLRTKFAWTQNFAGDVGIGATYIAPDTVRVTTVCSGDASGRTFNLYRLNWPLGQGSPPSAPPIPVAAVPLPGNPQTGPCSFVVDDFPGEGRWFYYAELEPDGVFPARYGRSFNAAVVPPDGGGGGTPERTALLSPRPCPASGPVTMPFDLASAGHVVMTIHDLRGRIVRTFDLGTRAAGEYHDVGAGAPVWDSRDDDGLLVRTGVYFETLSVDGNRAGDGERVVFLRSSGFQTGQ
jgi:hypothetical protein